MVNDDDLRSVVNPASSTSDTVPEGAQDLLAMATARAQLRPDVADILGAWLESQLRADQYARLEQAGHSVEDKIPLARVFVDLGVSLSPQLEPRGTGEHFEGFIESVLDRGPVRLTVGAIEPSHEPERAPSRARRRSSGYVLVGGPGQGKSTVGQFLCQLHRAALLGPRAASLSPEGRQALEALLAQCAGSPLAPPVRPSFPVRVVLGDFAAWLASTGAAAAAGLFRYLSERVQHATGRDVAPEELSKLLLACPCLLVFDGLDEVPVTSGRNEMLAALRDGLRQLGSGGAMGLVIATTRPQGYAGELLELNLSPLHLVPLSPERALDYAQRLAAVRFADRPDRQERVLERLTQASKEEATARLMRSPLQVTIMATLVDRIGRAPQERWSLFLDYYRVVYEREMERSIPAADLLRRYRSHIDRIHAKVGLLLQVESERSGGTEALMTRPRLEQVVEDTLLEDEFDKPQRAALTEIILGAALERLVFLVSPQEGKFGFEIRSLQEFMAAWALMSKSDASLLEQRLAQIAPTESFKNVFLFAASKCFTELSELRDAIVDRICPALNEVDDASRVTLAGSRLSLELLEEGSALNQPKYARRLMSLATRLLELPLDDVHTRLARACEGDAESPLQKAIGERLMLRDAGMRLPAWVTLVALIDRGVAWARELGEARWPEDPEEERQVFKTAISSTRPLGVWLQTRVAQRPASFPPSSLGLIPAWFLQSDHSDLLPKWISAVFEITYESRSKNKRLHLYLTDESDATPLTLYFRSIECDALQAWISMADMAHPPPSWRPLVESAKFVVSPTASTLVAALQSMHENFKLLSVEWMARKLPWLLRACLLTASSSDDLAVLASHAASGELGDQSDWLTAEAHWSSNGVQLCELIDASDASLPFRRLHQGSGVTFPALEIFWPEFNLNFEGSSKFDQLLNQLLDTQREASARNRGVLARWILDLLGHNRAQDGVKSEALSPSDVERLWNDAGTVLRLDSVHSLFDPEDPRWLELFARVAESGRFKTYFDSPWLLRPVLQALSLNPESKGLLRIAVSLVIDDFEIEKHVGGLPGIPIGVSMAQWSEDPDIRADATLLMLARGAAGLDRVDSVIKRLSSGSDANERLADAASIASMSIEDVALRERLLLALARAAAPDDWNTLRSVVRGLTRALRNRHSGLAEPTVWDRLALPPPRPEPLRPGSESDSTPPPSERTGSLQIESIKLLGLRIFDEITLATHPREDGTGQWIIVLGDNGVGKTTILRGVVLALAESAVSTTLLASLPAPLSRFNAKTSESIVRTREGTYRTRVQTESELEIAHEVASEESAARRPPLFAYGVRRGSSLGGPMREVKFSPILDVATLFDEAASVIHAETWLQTLALDAEQNPAKRPLFETILGALTSILPGVDAVRVRDKGVWVTRGREELPIAALSDGYLTTAGWFLDLIARWVDRAERRGETLGKGFTATMEGVVLVDEIDLHLHPHWQCTVIEAIRAIFPRMSFIVTTHNPLTLLGAREGEIFVLRRSRDAEGAEGPVNVRQVDLPKGARADQVLTGAWFGLPSTVDPETQALLDEHRRLLRKRNGGPQTRIQELEAILRERLGSFADTSLERLAQNVAAQLMDERYRELTPEERESIQREVKQRVRAQSGPSENGG